MNKLPISEYPKDEFPLTLLFSKKWSHPVVGFYLPHKNKFFPSQSETVFGAGVSSGWATLESQPTHFSYIITGE